MPGGSLWTGVRQWISSVLGTEKSIFLAWAIARMVPNAAWRKRELVRYEEGSSEGKVINIGENQTVGEGNMQGRNINNKQKGRNRGALWGANGNRREDPGGTLKEETAGPP